MSNKALSYVRRCLAIIPSIPVAGLGVLLCVAAEWGSDPLTTFELGLANVFNVQLGTASLCFEGVIFFVFLIVRRDLTNFGTLAWCFLIGPSMNFISIFLNPLLPAASEMDMVMKIGLIIAGSILIILSLAYYIPIGLGYQASDILAFITADIIHQSYGIGLIVAYAILFVFGVAMGASWGLCTIIAVLGYGPIIDRLMPIFEPFSFKVAGMKKEDKVQS